MKDGFYISTDKNVLDMDFINQYIAQHSYWGKDRSMEETVLTVANSLCFGVYNEAKEQVGFGRVVTDYIFFGYIMDVFIANAYQKKGLGKRLVAFILNHESIKKLNTVALKTKDAHSFYEQYGFKKIGDSALWMSIDKQKIA